MSAITTIEQLPFELSKLSLRLEVNDDVQPESIPNPAVPLADVDDVPDGGYGCVIAAAYSLITFV